MYFSEVEVYESNRLGVENRDIAMNTWHRGDDANWRIESIVHYDVTNYKTEDFHTTIDTGYPDETATVKPTIITYDLRITTNQKVKATE